MHSICSSLVDFLFVITELFRCLAVEMLQAEICQSLHGWKGADHFGCKFQMEGGVADQPLLVSE